MSEITSTQLQQEAATLLQQAGLRVALSDLPEYYRQRKRLLALTNRELVLACVGLDKMDDPFIAEIADRLDPGWHVEEALRDEASADRAVEDAVRKATGGRSL